MIVFDLSSKDDGEASAFYPVDYGVREETVFSFVIGNFSSLTPDEVRWRIAYFVTAQFIHVFSLLRRKIVAAPAKEIRKASLALT